MLAHYFMLVLESTVFIWGNERGLVENTCMSVWQDIFMGYLVVDWKMEYLSFEEFYECSMHFIVKCI